MVCVCVFFSLLVVLVVAISCDCGCWWWFSMISLCFFFPLGGSCGGCFLWLLLVAILMVFGGWHGGDYCGCGSCWPVVWWVC